MSEQYLDVVEQIKPLVGASVAIQLKRITELSKEYNIPKTELKAMLKEEEEHARSLEKEKELKVKEQEIYANETYEQRRDRVLKTKYRPVGEYPTDQQERIAKEIADKVTWGESWEQEKVTEKQAQKQATVELASIFNRDRQANIFNQLQPIFYDKAGIWWLWSEHETRWVRTDEVDILNIVQAATNHDVVSSKNRTEILNSLKQEGRKRIPKPIVPTWIQFKNVLVDISTGEEREVTPEFFVTNPIPWELHSERFIETPNMDKIFEEWVGKDHVKTLYEILAYCLLPSYPIHRLFCFVGAGMNGKSCFLELLRKFIGKANCCSTELDTLLQSRFEVTRLHKKLVCQMGETNFNEMSKTSMLKKLTGGDLIGFEYKNKDTFEDKNYAKIIISTNNLPPTTDKTLGFYRRWLILDFPNTFNEKKNILDEIPDEEYEMLAVKCLGVLKDLLDKREFTNEGTIEQRMEKYEAKSNFLEKFLELFVDEIGDGYITKSDFYKKFSSWSKENRHRDMSEKSVGMAMKKLGIESQKKHFDWMYDGKGGQARIWLGIKWKEGI